MIKANLMKNKLLFNIIIIVVLILISLFCLLFVINFQNIWHTIIFIAIIAIFVSIASIIIITKKIRLQLEEKSSELKNVTSNLEEIIKSRTIQLEELNIELEQKVSQRTSELKHKVEELQITRTAILNILEDVNLSKSDLEKSHSNLLKLNKQLENANNELKQMDIYKNQFLSVAAHELKTPLASIHGFVTLLQNKKILSNIKQRDYYISIIVEDANRLKKLIDDILDLSRLDIGSMKFFFEKIDVRELIKDVVKETYLIAGKKGITIKADVDDNIPDFVNTDKDRVSQILVNLINNAIKYSFRKGSAIDVYAKLVNENIEFSVKDNGTGIPKKYLEKIFERFYQVDSSYTRKVGGTGLGLAISKGIVEALGGSISVKSILNKGSTFTFLIPREQLKQGREHINIFSAKNKKK